MYVIDGVIERDGVLEPDWLLLDVRDAVSVWLRDLDWVDVFDCVRDELWLPVRAPEPLPD